MEEKKVCCICGKEFTEWGNNPWPVDMHPDHICCDECNDFVVVTARIRKMLKIKEN